nr:hypothetical protein [Tanacetum cinerariifolium]
MKRTIELPVCYDDDDDEERSDSLDDNIIFGLPPFSAIKPDEPVLSTEEPDNSLSMGDEHLDTIPATESDEFIKSGVETLIPIPSESEGIPEHVCDVPSHDNSPPLNVSKDQFEDYSESNEEFSSTDDDSFSFDKIDYVETSPPDSELVSSEETDNSLSMGDEHLDTIPAMESDELMKSSVEDLVPIPSESEGIPDTICDVHFVNNPTPLKAKDHVEIVVNYKDDISSIDDDSLYNENIEYVEALPHDSEVVSLEAAEIGIPEEEEIEDDNLHEKLLNVHVLIANIEALKDNPTLSSELLTKSFVASPKSFLEETNTFHNSLPEFENFYIDLKGLVVAVPLLIMIYLFPIMKLSLSITIILKRLVVAVLLLIMIFLFLNMIHEVIKSRVEDLVPIPSEFEGKISSGITTTHFDISLPDYEAFYFDDDHVKEISSGSTTTHSDISLSEYDSFIFEEFVDELAHIISPPEYDYFFFWNLPDPGELMFVLNSGIRENLSATSVNLPIEDDYSPLLAYVCLPTDRSDFTHEEFADELAHIISPPEYDCFYFRDLPDLGEWISSLNSRTHENISSTTCVNLPVGDDHSPLLAYVVKENQEKDKIGSKPDKNGKRGEAGKSQKQLQLKEEEKTKKTKKEWPKMHARIKSY